MPDSNPSNDATELPKNTRAVLASSEILFSASPLITLYTAQQNGVLKAKQPDIFGQIPLIFLEVSPLAQGAWWLPVCTVPDTPSDANIWGNWTELMVNKESVLVSHAMLRPQNAWCWVPAGVIEEFFSPVSFLGSVTGQHPSTPPK